MKEFSIETLASIIKAESADSANAVITGISTDSRTVRAGDCFFAINGENFDGHDYVGQSLGKGAVCAVIERETGFDGNILKVADTVKALGEIAMWYRNETGFKVAAITGSAGKTTTREMAYHVLRRHFSCTRAPKSFNNAVGVPLTLLSAGENHEILIVELGSNTPGEILQLAEIASPDIAVITNIYPAHLAGFGNIEAIIKEKASIAEGLRAGGKLLINGDFEDLIDHCRTVTADLVTFGEGAGCDIRAGELVSKGSSGELTIEKTKISVPLAGRANLLNALAAWAICSQFDISIEDFAEAISTFEAVDMRLQIQTAGPITIINDCYNANPASMVNALDCLSQVGTGHRKVFICGPMAELGTQSENLHHELGKVVAKSGVDVLAAAGDFAEVVAESARANSKNEDFEIFIFKNTNELCNNLSRFVQCDDIVLVKGSRSAKLEKAVVKLDVIRFDA